MPGNDSTLTSFGLLVLRVWLGLAMFYIHGLDKLTHFSDMAPKFADPLGIGPMPSLALVTFAETAGGLLLAIGLLTRFAALTLIIDLGVAFLMVHKMVLAGHGSGEMAFIYLAGYVALFIAGAGRFSLDKPLFGKGGKSSKSSSSQPKKD